MTDETEQQFRDLLYEAWGVIANAGMKTGRGWDSEHPEWVAAAERWREKWHASQGLTVREPRTVEEIASQQARSNASADATLREILGEVTA
jgi:hypothetical protein